MRIIFVGPVPPLLGGIAQHSVRLVEALRSRGHEVTVISWRSQYPKLLHRGHQLDDKTPPMPEAQYMLRWWSVVSWWRTRRMAQDSDLLLFPYVTPFLAVPQWFISGGFKNAAAVVHNALPHERMPLERTLARLALKRPSQLITHGQGVANDIRSLGTTGRIHVVPMPPTLEVRHSALPPRPPLRLLFFGFVRPYKGLGVAISAMATLLDSGIDARLTVVGEFWEPVDGFRRQVVELGLEDRVDIHAGYVTDDRLNEMLMAHHIVLAPYLEDTLSAVVPVALAAGRPVVSTLVRGVSEQLNDRMNGILVAPGDPEALARGVIKATDRLSQLAAGATESTPTWSAVAEAVVAPFE